MHVRKVEIFIYSLFSPAEKLSLPKRLKSDLIPIIRYSNKGKNSSQPICCSQTLHNLISTKFPSKFYEFPSVPNHAFQINIFNFFFI